MDREMAIDHLVRRKRKLESIHRQEFPKWTTPDLVALTVLLSEIQTLQNQEPPDDHHAPA